MSTDSHEAGSTETAPTKSVKPLRMASLLEGTSFLILLGATIVKRTGDTEVGVQIMGPVHGVLFLIFVVMILKTFNELGWSFPKAVGGIALGALPFGAFYLERKWLPRR